MSTLNDLHEKLVKYGYFYNPLFVDDYGIDINYKEPEKYKEETDLLYINSKVKNGKNMYKEFVKKNFKDRLNFKEYEDYKGLLNPILEVNTNYFGFSTKIPMMVLAKKQGIIFDEKEPNFNYIETELANKLPRTISKFEDLIKKGENSEYFEDFCEKVMVNDRSVSKQELKNPTLSALLYMGISEECKKDFTLYKDLRRISNNGINDEEFFSCFDTDKFLLLFGKTIIDKIDELYDAIPEIMDMFPQVYNYVHFVEELGLKYNPKISIPKENKKRIKLVPYTFEDLKRDCKRILEKHKDLSFKYVSAFDPIFDFDENHIPKKEDMEKEAVKYRYGESYQNITASWEFIKKGEVEKKVSKSRKCSTERKEREAIDVDYRLSVFNKTDYICQIHGKDKFIGYIGYIYPNGIVAFEKFYEENGNVSKDNNATYIMNINNFEHFSSLTKPEIMEYIKDMGNKEVDRKYHSKNWEKNIRKIAENPNFDEEIKERVKVVVMEGRKAMKLEY